MKWFGNFDPNEDIIDQYIKYISKTTERTERYTTIGNLLYHLRKGEVSEEQKRKIVDTRQARLISKISLTADNTLVQYIIDSEINAQNVIASLLHNPTITKVQIKALIDRCDESTRGIINENIAHKMLDED